MIILLCTYDVDVDDGHDDDNGLVDERNDDICGDDDTDDDDVCGDDDDDDDGHPLPHAYTLTSLHHHHHHHS